MDDLFELLPEGTRIVIHGNKVTFENLTPDMVDVAHELSPDDGDIARRMESTSEIIHAPEEK